MFELIINTITGLGIFLYGMNYMEYALKEAASGSFKRIVKNSTKTTFKAILTGAGVTGILQSSSVVTLMTLSFVSASLMSLKSGIGVIFGSNIGTTATAWIVALVGFKLKIELFALPMIGIGGILFMMFVDSRPKVASIAKILIGFGLLFFGLDLIKNAVEALSTSFDVQAYSHYPLPFFIFLGFIITAIIQSSSATTAITLSALFANIIPFEAAAAMIIGANIGTTVTAFLGAIGGVPDKKRIATAHFLFNFITAAVAYLLMPVMIWFIFDFLGFKNDLTTALALFHTIFNLLGVLIFIPFINILADFLGKLFVIKELTVTKYIHLATTTNPEPALVALRDETTYLFSKVIKFFLLTANIKPRDLLKRELSHKEIEDKNNTVIEFDFRKGYRRIKYIQAKMLDFVVKIHSDSQLDSHQTKNLDEIMSHVRDIVYSAKVIKDIKNNIDMFANDENEGVRRIYNLMRENIIEFMQLYIDYIEELISQEDYRKKYEALWDKNKEIHRAIAENFTKYKIHNNELISLNNTNRSIYMAFESLYDASSILVLHFAIEKDNEI